MIAGGPADNGGRISGARDMATAPVLENLRAHLEACGSEPLSICVALSGGLDSTVLLHALRNLNSQSERPGLRALHVNHHLQRDAGRWQRSCAELCEHLGVDLVVRDVRVEPTAGLGLEAAARQARYRVFAESLAPNEYLLTAHHEDDQLETVLLRLLRGSGVRGLGGIPALRRLAAGWVMRPLLEVSRRELLAYANAHRLTWIDDPSNRNTSLDRNYLRHRVVPLLRERWPASGLTVGRAARHSEEAANLLEELASDDAASLGATDTVDLQRLSELSAPRQRNLLRYLLSVKGIQPPTYAQLEVGLQQITHAKHDAAPRLRWSQGEIRRYRQRLYILDFHPEDVAEALPGCLCWRAGSAVELGAARGHLHRQPGGRIADRFYDRDLTVRFRAGGERVRLQRTGHRQALKKLFQASGILPWMREHVPLVYCADRLLAVADLWVEEHALAEPDERGWRVSWRDHALTR